MTMTTAGNAEAQWAAAVHAGTQRRGFLPGRSGIVPTELRSALNSLIAEARPRQDAAAAPEPALCARPNIAPRSRQPSTASSLFSAASSQHRTPMKDATCSLDFPSAAVVPLSPTARARAAPVPPRLLEREPSSAPLRRGRSASLSRRRPSQSPRVATRLARSNSMMLRGSEAPVRTDEQYRPPARSVRRRPSFMAPQGW